MPEQPYLYQAVLLCMNPHVKLLKRGSMQPVACYMGTSLETDPRKKIFVYFYSIQMGPLTYHLRIYTCNT